jgi:hypothetical protein
MTSRAQRDSSSLPGILKLSNEFLFNIASHLSTPDLRRLSRVDPRLNNFVENYLTRFRYNVGLVALPDEILLKIVQHLGCQKYRSRFARASLRFYPLTMEYIIRHDVRFDRSILLNYAAWNNLKEMARTILHLGGDANARWVLGVRLNSMENMPTPLVSAAIRGHTKIVRILLESGASQFVGESRVALTAAILKGHENVALLLSQGLDPDETPLKKKKDLTVLQIACEAKLVKLVRYYLERGSRCEGPENTRSSSNYSIALYRVLNKDASKGSFLKREIHEDAYQIVLMLLQHGANPDLRIKVSPSSPATARGIASRHPDPRIRYWLSNTIVPAVETKESPLLIGRPWISTMDDALKPDASQADTLPSEIRRFVSLWNFFERPSTGTPTRTDEDGTGVEGISDESYTLGDLGFESFDSNGFDFEDTNLGTNPEPLEPPPLSSYPQLGITKAGAQHAAKAFWSRIPAQTVTSSSTSIRTSNNESRGASSKKGKQSENTKETEPFPQLGRPDTTSNDTGKNTWTDFRKDKVPQSTNDTVHPTANGQHEGMGQSTNKSKKKKKWEPLSI